MKKGMVCLLRMKVVAKSKNTKDDRSKFTFNTQK